MEYTVRWVLKSRETGEVYSEIMEHMTLTDFEVAYGDITDEIISLVVSKEYE